MILYQVPLGHAQKPYAKYKIKLPAVSKTAQHYWQTTTSKLCLLSGSSNKSKHPAACRALSEYTMPVQADLFRTMTSTWRVLQLILLCTFCQECPWKYEMFPDVSGKEKKHWETRKRSSFDNQGCLKMLNCEEAKSFWR